MRKSPSKEVLQYYQSKKVLEHYDEATRRIGLWKSEELVFRQAFPSERGSLLELGCGTGRIAFSLWSLGYEKIWATDFFFEDDTKLLGHQFSKENKYSL